MSEEIQEICRRLKPVIGRQADRYWLAYLSEDWRGRQELEIALRLLQARLLGSDVQIPQVHLSAPPRELARGEYPLGQVMYAEKVLYPFGLREDEWIQHTAIFGRSGAGKTNTVFVVIGNLLRAHKPFLIFDWKRNYRDILDSCHQEILIYTVGRSIIPFAFNPLIPPEGTDPATWLKKLIEIIAHAYYLGEGVMFLLQEALHAVYQDFSLYSGRPEKYPTFQDVLLWLEEHPAKGRKALWMDSALRGVKSICFGHMGSVVNTAVQPNLAALLEKNVILELDSLTNSDKNLVIESMLLWIHHWRMAQDERETFKHAMIIEEAHHILLKRTGAGSGGEAITDTILREIRELGEAIILVDQHPSLISIPAMGNTYTTIAMNVKHRSDVNAVAGAMLMNDEDREILGRLPVGMAVVKLQGRWIQPFLLKIPHMKIKKGAVGDDALMQLMAKRDVLQIPGVVSGKASANLNSEKRAEISPEPAKHDLTERDKIFLVDVMAQPLVGVVQRYRGLGFSRRKGNTLREACMERGWLVPVVILTRAGKTVLLDLTVEGRRLLRDLGHQVPDRSRWGSLEHEFWKQKTAEHLRNLGWKVAIEEMVNGFTDLIAEKDGETMAVEIETGRSDWRANIDKNVRKGLRKILIIATSPEAFDKIHAEVSEMIVPAEVQVEKAQDIA